MSTELDDKLRQLELMHRALRSVRNGRGDKRKWPEIPEAVPIAAIFLMAWATYKVVTSDLPTDLLDGIGAFFSILGPAIAVWISYSIWLGMTIHNYPKWADFLAESISSYAPIDLEARERLSAAATDSGDVLYDQIHDWLQAETMAVKKAKADLVVPPTLNIPGFRRG